MDQQFIELFKTDEVWAEVDKRGTGAWVPWWETLPRTVRKGRLEDEEILKLEGKGEEKPAEVGGKVRRMVLGL